MKSTRALFVPTLAVALATAAFAQQTPTKPAEELPDAPQATAAAMIHPNGPTVVMDTSMGRITCQFFQRQAQSTGPIQPPKRSSITSPITTTPSFIASFRSS